MSITDRIIKAFAKWYVKQFAPLYKGLNKEYMRQRDEYHKQQAKMIQEDMDRLKNENNNTAHG